MLSGADLLQRLRQTFRIFTVYKCDNVQASRVAPGTALWVEIVQTEASQQLHRLLWNLVQTFMVPRGRSRLLLVIPWLTSNASRSPAFKVITWNISTSSGLTVWTFCADSHGPQKHWSMNAQFVVFRVKVSTTIEFGEHIHELHWHQVKYLLCLLLWFITQKPVKLTTFPSASAGPLNTVWR